MKNKKIKHSKISFKEMFGLAVDKTQGIMQSCPSLLVNSLGNITIQNCNSISLYTENEICLDMKRLSILIKGDAIVMDTLEKGLITVHGRIFCIEFLYNKER